MSEEKDFNVFAGAETGIFKGLNINSKCSLSKNFDKISNLTKESSISCMSYGEDEQEILIGLRSQYVKVFDVKDKSYSTVVETKAGTGPLVGVARYNEAILTAVESGLVKLWKYENPVELNPIDYEVRRMGKLKKEIVMTEEEKEKHAESLKIGRKLCKLRQCRESKNLVAVGGKELDLQIWDLDKSIQEPIFRAKNVRPDFLQMRVPVWISDLAFLSESSVATCSRYGHIRKYDIKSSQRRPTVELIWTEKDDAFNCTTIFTVNENQVLVGTATGKLGLWDFRVGAGFKGLIRKYKGCTGAIREITSPAGSEYFSVVGLDRHLRVYKIKEQKPVFTTYLKSKLTGVLMTSNFDPEAKTENVPGVEKVEEEEDDDLILIDEPEDTGTQPEDYTVSVANTKLENLLSLSESDYKDKSHPFFEFFKDSKKQRKLLKTTESEEEREQALAKIRKQFENFQLAHSRNGLQPAKKRKLN